MFMHHPIVELYVVHNEIHFCIVLISCFELAQACTSSRQFISLHTRVLLQMYHAGR